METTILGSGFTLMCLWKVITAPLRCSPRPFLFEESPLFRLPSVLLCGYVPDPQSPGAANSIVLFTAAECLMCWMLKSVLSRLIWTVTLHAADHMEVGSHDA